MSLHGEADVEIARWVHATVKADVKRAPDGGLDWTVEGDAHQATPITLGAVTVHDAHVHARYAGGQWEPVMGELHVALPHVIATLAATVDLAKNTVSGTGQAEVVDPIKMGPLSLDEGQVEATVVDNELTEVTGHAKQPVEPAPLSRGNMEHRPRHRTGACRQQGGEHPESATAEEEQAAYAKRRGRSSCA